MERHSQEGLRLDRYGLTSLKLVDMEALGALQQWEQDAAKQVLQWLGVRPLSFAHLVRAHVLPVFQHMSTSPHASKDIPELVGCAVCLLHFWQREGCPSWAQDEGDVSGARASLNSLVVECRVRPL